jgi:hypothetical protein
VFDRNAIKVGVIANECVGGVGCVGRERAATQKKTPHGYAKSSRIVPSPGKDINRGRINAVFFMLDELSEVAFAALIRADLSANE